MGVMGFSLACIISCGLNVIASMKIWRLLSIPYIILELIRLCLILACHVTYCMIVKKQLNLGVLIALSCSGGFVLLGLGYIWCCSIAFFQIVGVVNSRSYQKLTSVGSPIPQKFQRNITISTISPNFKQPVSDFKFEKSTPTPEIFVSDFSKFYRQTNYRN